MKLSQELTKFRNQQRSDSVSAALKNAIFAVQNIGFNFYERRFQYDSALLVVSRVMSVWKEIKDTVNLANNLKFRGLILAHLNNFDSAKANIEESIRLFDLKHFPAGVNVANYDLARLYLLEDSLNTAFTLCEPIKAFWKAKANSLRIYIINNLMLDILTLKKDFQAARIIQIENNKYESSSDSYDVINIDYYYLSEKLYQRTGDKNKESFYRLKYQNLVKKAKRDNEITLKSSFE